MNSDWYHPDLHICKSSIHGQGCFTKKPISKNTILLIFGGLPFIQSLEELRAKTLQERDQFYRSVIHISDDFYLKAFNNNNPQRPFRLINHSCDPNLIIEGHVVVRAFKNISEDTELCLDYSTMGNPADDHTIIKKCCCQADICRKQITSYEWKSLSLQKKYGIHFSFAILKKINQGYC